MYIYRYIVFLKYKVLLEIVLQMRAPPNLFSGGCGDDDVFTDAKNVCIYVKGASKKSHY